MWYSDGDLQTQKMSNWYLHFYIVTFFHNLFIIDGDNHQTGRGGKK